MILSMKFLKSLIASVVNMVFTSFYSFRVLPHGLTPYEYPIACVLLPTVPPSVLCTVLLSGTVPAAGVVKWYASAVSPIVTAAPSVCPLVFLCGLSPALMRPAGVFVYPNAFNAVSASICVV